MNRHRFGFAVGLLFSASLGIYANAQSTFDLKCHPFKALEAKHAIDGSCPSAAGDAQPATSGHALQNIAKNNFCAGGQAVDITHDDLLQLQSAAQKIPGYQNWNRENLPPSRDPFTKNMSGKFKEGMLVRYTGFIYELHAADVESGESVNCAQTGADVNDIHIAFVASPPDRECTSITAEMSPHFRPNAWVASDMAPKIAAFLEPSPGKWVSNAPGKRLSRVTGQLMFDAAHKPCTGGQPNKGDPSRASLWEVHPVYAMEVCTTTGAKCADTDWKPLDQFLGSSASAGTNKPHKKKLHKSASGN
jgi:hypothetical protein